MELEKLVELLHFPVELVAKVPEVKEYKELEEQPDLDSLPLLYQKLIVYRSPAPPPLTDDLNKGVAAAARRDDAQRHYRLERRMRQCLFGEELPQPSSGTG